MALKLGTTSIGAIYKGTTPINFVYKGVDLVFTKYKFINFESQYVYNTLIPSTISSDNVLTNGRARLNTISGNGVIENQLFYPRNSGTPYGITITNNGDGSLTFNGTATSNGYPQLNDWDNHPISLLANHKYLILGGTSALSIILGSFTLTTSGIITPTSNITTIQTSISNGTTYNETKYIQIIDLTLMFGTGNEPTTTSDSRIQKIISKGYIPYNIGTYKNSYVSEVEYTSYNLLNIDRTQGTQTDYAKTTPRVFDETKYYIGFDENNYYSPDYISNVSITSNSISLQSSNGGFGIGFPVKVSGGIAYTFSCTENNRVDIAWYDKNGVWVNKTANVQNGNSINSPTNAYWCLLVFRPNTGAIYTYTNPCLHLTSGRTGYLPYKTPTKISIGGTLQLNGAINSHDTFEITSSGYVFTKNLGTYTFQGTENFSVGGAISSGLYRYYTLAISSMESGEGLDGLCDKYATDKGGYNTATSPCIRFGQSNYAIYFYLTQNYAQGSDVATAISGTKIIYPLATTQTITIPKKHLGCVDLGTRTWVQRTGSSIFYAQDFVNTKRAGALYCILYSHDTENQIANMVNMSMWNTTDGYGANAICIRNDNYNNATDFKNAMSGIYLFYETDAEVVDFLNETDYQVGGLINTNEFRYIENNFMTNGNFESTTWWTVYNSSGTTLTVEKNEATVTSSGTYSSGCGLNHTLNLGIPSGHKVLLTFELKTSIAGSYSVYAEEQTNFGTKLLSLTTSYQKFVYVFETTSNTGTLRLFLSDFGVSGQTFNIRNVMYIDLTQAFGSGNEPISINDYRIQYIINKGYIDTNTTGTSTGLLSEILCDLTLKVQKQ